VLASYVHGGQPLGEAIAAPRLHVRLLADGPPSSSTRATSTCRSAWPTQAHEPSAMFFGGVGAALRTGDGQLLAAGDPRRAASRRSPVTAVASTADQSVRSNGEHAAARPPARPREAGAPRRRARPAHGHRRPAAARCRAQGTGAARAGLHRLKEDFVAVLEPIANARPPHRCRGPAGAARVATCVRSPTPTGSTAWLKT
jgi:hypothetical protein